MIANRLVCERYYMFYVETDRKMIDDRQTDRWMNEEIFQKNGMQRTSWI